MLVVAIIGAWLLLAPLAGCALGRTIRVADQAEQQMPRHDEADCPPAGEGAAADAPASVPVDAAVARA